jgi:DNA invertase Pin-like site-specific DNA recombinase
MANEMYAKDISKKIRSTMKSLQAQGKFIGSQPPYGYMRNPEDKYALLVDPETAPVVREMFQKILDGYTVHNITLQFNERGIPSPGRYKYDKGLVKNAKFRDSVWFFPTLRRMLSDPIYLGWIQNGKYESHFQKEETSA